MRYFFPFQPLKFDREPEGGSGDHIDPGAPHFHSLKDDPPEKAKPEKTEVEKTLDQLRADNDRLRRELGESKESERHWAEQARGRNRQPEREEVDDDPEPKDETPDLTPEQFLDVLSKEGIAGLKKFGFMTQADVQAEVKRIRTEMRQEVGEVQDGAAFDQQLAREFPDLWEDGQKVNTWIKGGKRGAAPETSDLYKRTAERFREMVEDAGVDPESKPARGMMRAAARQAKKELDMESRTTRTDREDREERRRDRIERQSGDRGRGGDEPDEGRSLSKTQQSVAKFLNVSEKEWRNAERQLEHDGVTRGR